MENSAFPVRHNVQAQRFETGDGETLSIASYSETPGVIVFTHTVVPAALRGRNIAEQLVRTGLAWARERGAKVVPQCSYVARFIERHSEYHDLLGDAHGSVPRS